MILVGPPASGKTCIARNLASLAGATLKEARQRHVSRPSLPLARSGEGRELAPLARKTSHARVPASGKDETNIITLLCLRGPQARAEQNIFTLT